MDFEDSMLVLRLNRGDTRALHRVYDKYKDCLVTLAGALLIDTSGAHDVVHDVFCGFIEHMEHFRLTGSLKGYLSTCVANRVRNCNRNRSRKAIHRLNETEYHGPLHRLELNEQAQRVVQALQRLPEEQREVVALRVYAGQRFPEIARHQGVSVNTVEGRFRYALKKLRDSFDNEVN